MPSNFWIALELEGSRFMSNRKMRLSGGKLRMVARLIESKVSGAVIRKQVMRQLGLKRIWDSSLDESEPPFALPMLMDHAQSSLVSRNGETAEVSALNEEGKSS